MVRLRRTKKQQQNPNMEDDFAFYDHTRSVEFHPHCIIQPMALADTRQFDEAYALAHAAPVYGDEE